MVDEDPHRLVADRIPQGVPVLEDHHDGQRIRELLDKEWNCDLRDRARAGAERVERGGTRMRMHHVQAQGELIPEAHRIGVTLVERLRRDPRVPRSLPSGPATGAHTCSIQRSCPSRVRIRN